MSEKTKTPRELAIEYARSLWKTNHGNIMLVADSERDYLAGLEAGAKMGWEAAMDKYDSFSKLELDDWWASLAQTGEGEK